jgi:predicted permease
MVSAALDRLHSVPGVETASVATFVPLNDHFFSRSLLVYTDHLPEGRRIEHSWNSIGPDYLSTIGIELLAGREFERADREGVTRGLIVNEAFARIAFGNASPLGQRVRFGTTPPAERTVVGVARNSKYSTVGEKDRPAVYESYYQAGGGRSAINFLVRVSGPPAASLKPLDAALLSLDGSAASETKAMTDAMAFALMPSRIGAGMLGSFGLLGLALATVGFYGVLAYSIGRRTREIGLRMALGARRRQLMALVLREGAAVLASGMLVGGIAALLLTKPLARFLVPSVHPADAIAFSGVAIALIGAGLAASLRPALRAISIDPMTALREE